MGPAFRKLDQASRHRILANILLGILKMVQVSDESVKVILQPELT
jgi:hypothetical protein